MSLLRLNLALKCSSHYHVTLGTMKEKKNEIKWKCLCDFWYLTILPKQVKIELDDIYTWWWYQPISGYSQWAINEKVPYSIRGKSEFSELVLYWVFIRYTSGTHKQTGDYDVVCLRHRLGSTVSARHAGCWPIRALAQRNITKPSSYASLSITYIQINFVIFFLIYLIKRTYIPVLSHP